MRKVEKVEFMEDDIFRVIIHLPSETSHETDDETSHETDNLVEADIERLIVNLMLKNSIISIGNLLLRQRFW